MPYWLATGLCLVLTGSAVALSACSSSSPDVESGNAQADYADQLNEISGRAQKSISDLAEKLPGAASSVKATTELLGSFADRVNGLASEIEAIEPPDSATALHRRLVGLMRRLAGKARDAAGVLQDGGQIGVSAALAGVAKDSGDLGHRIDTTIDRIGARLGRDAP